MNTHRRQTCADGLTKADVEEIDGAHIRIRQASVQWHYKVPSRVIEMPSQANSRFRWGIWCAPMLMLITSQLLYLHFIKRQTHKIQMCPNITNNRVEFDCATHSRAFAVCLMNGWMWLTRRQSITQSPSTGDYLIVESAAQQPARPSHWNILRSHKYASRRAILWPFVAFKCYAMRLHVEYNDTQATNIATATTAAERASEHGE